MIGTTHTQSSPGLYRGPYAKCYRPWPPAGFTEPDRAELDEVLRHRTWMNLRKFTVDQLVRWLEVMDWFGSVVHRTPGLEGQVVDFMHVVRRELSKRPDRRPFTSVRVLRCCMCQHATERLWEATGESHNVTERDGEPFKGSAFMCARCWSDYLITDEEN